ncbi:hypothetical protein ACFL2H_08955 [Planctomycetota bacterium]
MAGYRQNTGEKPRSRKEAAALVARIGIGFLVLNLFGPPILAWVIGLFTRWYWWGEWIDVAATVLVIAQLELVSFWAVFPKSRAIVQLPCILLLISVLHFTIANGCALAIGGTLPATSAGAIKLAVIGACILSTAFMLCKRAFKWSIEPPFNDVSRSMAHFSVIELVACVSLVSLALVVTKNVAMDEVQLTSSEVAITDWSEIPGANFFFLAPISWTIVSSSLIIYAVFRRRSLRFVCVWAAVTIPISAIELICLQQLGEWRVTWPKSFFIMYLVNAFPTLLFALVLHRLHVFGFRLAGVANQQ